MMLGLYPNTEDEFDPFEDDSFSHASLSVTSKKRFYKHFDLPLTETHSKKIFNFEEELKKHRFLPLLGYTHVERKYVRGLNDSKKQIIKKREIRFASHSDSFYLQAYAEYLNYFYEKELHTTKLTDSVLAYRKGGLTNIHHAKHMFDEVHQRRDCTVISLDISGFFDKINHLILRDEILSLLKESHLSKHHYTVWRNITRYSWVNIKDIDDLLGKKRKKDRRICSKKDFETHIRGRKKGLVRTNKTHIGIPQGTPISGLYANIYMKSFDCKLLEICKKYKGSYRRYSDDIAIIIPEKVNFDFIVEEIKSFLDDIKLTISVPKTEISHFKDGILISQKPLQYLGFIFDGNQIMIRPSSISTYLRKMRKGIHAKMVAAKMKRENIASDHIFQRQALSRYTHLGRRNFIRYAYKSAQIMESPIIYKQVRRHTTWFKRMWNKEKNKVFS